MKKTIFREYDIRGVVGVDFTPEFAEVLGRAYAKKVKETLGAKERYLIGVGRDCRLTGPEISEYLIKGLIEEGLDVMDCGMGATPQLYFSVYDQNLDGGIQVTASHNPSDQNGFKLMIGKGTLSGPDIQDLLHRIEADGIGNNQVNNTGVVGHVKTFNAPDAYRDFLIKKSTPFMGKRKLKVVVDGGNGVGGPVGVQVLKALGCEVIELYTDPDGRFPNHHPDPTVLENIKELRRVVVSEKADFGIGWDGDADRIGVVDENGEAIFGDMLLIIFGRQLLKEVSNPTIIADVKCSQTFFDILRKEGANTVMAKTGHSLIKAKLKELHAELAGEMSGHIFFSHRYLGFDDALHAAARLVEIMSNTEHKISELLSGVPKMFSTPEMRIDFPEEFKFKIVEVLKTKFPDYEVNTLDGVRVTFPNGGWGLARASNTQAAIVTRFEAASQTELDQYRKLFEDRMNIVAKEVQAAK